MTREESVEVSDIFRKHGQAYRVTHKMLLNHIRTMRAIERCRTAELGGHVDECDCCGHIRISYNSCRNRHCPKCQFLKKEKWLEERKEDLLPVPYFHVVFTIPAKLNPLALRNKRVLYNILFRCVSETLNLPVIQSTWADRSDLSLSCTHGDRTLWITLTFTVS